VYKTNILLQNLIIRVRPKYIFRHNAMFN